MQSREKNRIDQYTLAMCDLSNKEEYTEIVFECIAFNLLRELEQAWENLHYVTEQSNVHKDNLEWMTKARDDLGKERKVLLQEIAKLEESRP